MKIKFRNWPWQIRPKHWSNPKGTTGKKCGWSLDQGGMGRLGGGWPIKLGLMMSKNTLVLELIFGSIRIERKK